MEDQPGYHLQGLTSSPPRALVVRHLVWSLITALLHPLREVYRVTESLQREKSGLLKQLDFLRCELIPEPRRVPPPPESHLSAERAPSFPWSPTSCWTAEYHLSAMFGPFTQVPTPLSSLYLCRRALPHSSACLAWYLLR